MEKCKGVLTETGWVPKCYPDKFGGDFTHSINSFTHSSFIERMFDNPLFGTFSILAFSAFAVLGILLMIWIIAIKGYALWIASQRKEKWWFIAILIINTIGILEIVYLVFFAKKWRLGGNKEERIKSESDSGHNVQSHDNNHTGVSSHGGQQGKGDEKGSNQE